MKKITFISIFALILFANNCYCQDGSLDTSFGTDGKVTTDFGDYDVPVSIAIQDDGKIVAAGYRIGDSGAAFAIARYNINGSLDTSFDGDGKTMITFENNFNLCSSIVIQNDGKIVVAGTTTTTIIDRNRDVAIVRLNIDGSIDTTFGVNGKVITSIDYTDDARQVILQNDGKIIVAGTSINSDYNLTRCFLVRYNTDGSLDPSFGNEGKAIVDFGLSYCGTNTVAIQSDNKIIIGGYSGPEFALIRLNTDGSLDITFDVDGKVTTDIDNIYYEEIEAIVLQSNGKIVVSGIVYGRTQNVVIARYNNDGSLDSTFGNDGFISSNFTDTDESGSSIALQNDGKIIVNVASAYFDFIILRFNSNGTLDNTFDGDGKLNTDFGNNEISSFVKLQSDNKIILAGRSDDNFALVRYNNTVLSNNYYHINNDFSISPNPVSNFTQITTQKNLNNATLKVHNSYGQCIKEINSISGNLINLNFNQVSSGIYFITIEDNNESKMVQKIIIK